MEKIVIKECKKHGETEFVLRNDGRYRCKKCCVEAVQRRREKMKKLLIEYKGGKCEICGYDRCKSALEFHHVDPNKKKFGIGEGNTRSLDENKKEVDKCVLVCANCHREIHEGLIDIEEFLKNRGV